MAARSVDSFVFQKGRAFSVDAQKETRSNENVFATTFAQNLVIPT